ncbi:histone deacetylase family protein [Derxia gummosa]|uniref:Histone deacetylase family protein n=1 Tax=Derxia gummosa DSM 723 TaxID=1121388 RepID=A0A8B6X190_9BURK|nr:histone deacetylase family protein [Derxia gummosa]
MLPAYITHSDCAKHEMGKDHPEAPERLGAVSDQLLIKGLLDVMQSYDAPLATEEQLARAHSALYVRETLSRCPTEGYEHVDPDTMMCPHTARAALRSAGAAILATDLVIDGKAPTAFCNVRPPGHHAEREQASGFCFFNNVAVAIRHALDDRGFERVALIDFDVHHGNGSEDILAGDDRVLMCSIFQTGIYPFSGDTPMGKNMVNVPLPAYSTGEKFREAVDYAWIPALDRFKPQIIFISAGFDGHREDDMGQLGLVESDYEWVTRQLVAVAERHCDGRIVSVLEGGYALSSLGRSAAAHVKVLIGAD